MIQDMLQKSYDSYISTYSNGLSASKEAVSPLKLDKMHEQAAADARKVFNSKILELKKEWLQNEQTYKAQLALAEQTTAKTFEEFKGKNEEKIAIKAKEVATSLLENFDAEQKNFSPFPDEEIKLSEKANILSLRLLETYSDKLKDFSTSNAFAEAKDNLKKQFTHKLDEVLDRNIKTLKSTSYSVFKCAQKKIDAVDCVFCLANLWPWSFQSLSSQYAMECFELDPKANTISAGLKNKVISDWYTVDLAAERLAVHNNFLRITFSIFAVIAVSLYFTIFKKPLLPGRDLGAIFPKVTNGKK